MFLSDVRRRFNNSTLQKLVSSKASRAWKYSIVLVAVVCQGDWKVGAGWRGSQIGYFYGGATIQGLLPYYYTNVAPGTAREVNR